MSQREEILRLLSGKKINNTPAFSGLIHITAEGLQSEGLALHEVHKDSRKLAKASASTFKLSGLPSAVATTSTSRCTMNTSALGNTEWSERRIEASVGLDIS